MNERGKYLSNFLYFRCAARCKTSVDGCSIQFIDIDHNHGVNTGIKNGLFSDPSNAATTVTVKTEYEEENETI